MDVGGLSSSDSCKSEPQVFADERRSEFEEVLKSSIPVSYLCSSAKICGLFFLLHGAQFFVDFDSRSFHEHGGSQIFLGASRFHVSR